MDVSFCVTCRDRLADLGLTLGRNLDQLRGNEEIVLLDYNCPAGTYWWATTHHRSAIDDGRLRVYAERTAARFFMAHAKNVAHLLGTGRVLVNLDADNTLDPEYLATLRDTDWDKVAMLYPLEGSGGFKGRTAITAATFLALGGYDEDMCHGYGVEEIDLYYRVKCLKIPCRHITIDPRSAIPTLPERKAEGQLDPADTIKDTERRHHAISREKLQARIYVRNGGRVWGAADLVDHDSWTTSTGMTTTPLTWASNQ